MIQFLFICRTAQSPDFLNTGGTKHRQFLCSPHLACTPVQKALGFFPGPHMNISSGFLLNLSSASASPLGLFFQHTHRYVSACTHEHTLAYTNIIAFNLCLSRVALSLPFVWGRNICLAVSYSQLQ